MILNAYAAIDKEDAETLSISKNVSLLVGDGRQFVTQDIFLRFS
tara:strand:- start:580 stop:711 length:132 start_codon:yes stop_codon:yes gene_type:complete